MPDPNAPVFSYDQVDPYSTQGGGQPVSLGTTEGNVGTPPGGDSYWYNYFRRGLNSSPAPVGYNTTNQDQARLEQQRVIQALQAQAAGDPNSQAQQQLRNAYGQAQAQQSSLGSTMRGQSAGAALRGIQQGQQDIARGLPGDQQMLQLQEQQAAQSMLAQMLQQQQQQDIAQAQGMAGNTLGNRALEDQMKGFYLNGMLGQDVGASDRAAEIARARLGFNDQMRGLYTQLANNGVNGFTTGLSTWAGMGGGGGGGGGGGLTANDGSKDHA